MSYYKDKPPPEKVSYAAWLDETFPRFYEPTYERRGTVGSHRAKGDFVDSWPEYLYWIIAAAITLFLILVFTTQAVDSYPRYIPAPGRSVPTEQLDCPEHPDEMTDLRCPR